MAEKHIIDLINTRIKIHNMSHLWELIKTSFAILPINKQQLFNFFAIICDNSYFIPSSLIYHSDTNVTYYFDNNYQVHYKQKEDHFFIEVFSPSNNYEKSYNMDNWKQLAAFVALAMKNLKDKGKQNDDDVE